jgi:oligopeptidase B
MRLFRILSSLLLLALSPLLLAQSVSPQPPVARQVEHTSVWHGEKVNDPYFWLRDKSNPEVIKYLEAENAYTEAMTRDLRPFGDTLYKEMLSHIKQTDLSVPTRRGAYFYYSRTEEGKQYPIRCRKRAAADGSFDDQAREEVLLDPNELARGLKFLSVGAFVVSDDDNLLAYTTDVTGFRQFRLQVKDLRTGAILPSSVEGVTSVEWCADNRTLFYTTEDPVTKRSNLVWRHVLGEETEPVYQEKDRLYPVHLGRSKDRKMLFLNCFSTTRGRLFFYLATSRKLLSRSFCQGRKGTSTPSSIARGFSIFGRIGTLRIFAWSQHRWQTPHRGTGRSCSPIGPTCCSTAWSYSGIMPSRRRNPRPRNVSVFSTSPPASGTR